MMVKTSTGAAVCQDGAGFLVLVAVSTAVGWAVNVCRDPPLPLRYQPPADRLAAAVTRAETNSDHQSPIQTTNNVSLEELKSLLRKPETLVLDARHSLFYETGHIPGALNLSRKDFERDFQRLQSRLKNVRVRVFVVYCADADCEDGQIVAEALARLGFGLAQGEVTPGRVIRVFRGGWEGWLQGGGKVEGGS